MEEIFLALVNKEFEHPTDIGLVEGEISFRDLWALEQQTWAQETEFHQIFIDMHMFRI